MFILNDILKPLQNAFSSAKLGTERGLWFSYTILAFIIPFTPSISSNVLRCLNTLFGLNRNRRRFYTFMASNNLKVARKSQIVDKYVYNQYVTGEIR